MMPRIVPHPSNARGDFYVEDGCCLTCAVPFDIAPDLFAWVEGEGQCYVKKQPATPAELDRMLAAIAAAEAQCIRYKGRERAIGIRLAQTGDGAVCDAPELHIAEDRPRPCPAENRPPSLLQRISGWLRSRI